MRTPATFGRFLQVACYAVGIAQLAVLGVVFLVTMVSPLVYASKSQLPDVSLLWLVAADVVLSIVLVFWSYVMYLRGDLDEYSVRRGKRR